jgi:transporter family-2 protein
MLMLVAGLGIPTMAALNAGLNVKLQSPFLAVTILLFVGFCVACSILLSTEGVPKSIYTSGTPWYFYMGGVLFVLYISSVTWVIPKFGVANSIGVVLLGQLIAMSLLDHFGAFGGAKYEIDIKRLSGLVLMAMGVFLVVSQPEK